MKFSPAFTLVEILVSVAIIGIVSLMSGIAISTARTNQLVNHTADLVSQVMERASIASQNSRDESRWGVISDDSKQYSIVSQKEGGEMVAVTPYLLPENLHFSSPFQIWFEKGTGRVKSDASIAIIGSAGRSATIHIPVNGSMTTSSP